MIVVFVVDTSPSMSRPAIGDSGLSRLDVAKMAVESAVRQWRKMQAAHRTAAANTELQRSFDNLGQLPLNDQFLLLSTSRQHPDTGSCAAGGRLLVGYHGSSTSTDAGPQAQQPQQQQQEGGSPATASADFLAHQEQRKAEAFQRELKGLKAAVVTDPNKPFPDDAGGAEGLNAALSSGLQLLSRYRLQNRQTENFGMGRLPSTAISMPDGSLARAALQPACLVLLTDGACLRLPPKQGGGALQLKYGSLPLKELYQEPFRWDQRIFVQAVGARDGVASTQYLHPHLRTLCEVTGGAHWAIGGTSSLQSVTESLLRSISPPMPSTLPLPDPLYQDPTQPLATIAVGNGAHFVNAGPICCFRSLESDENSSTTSGAPSKFRAMLLYTSSSATASSQPDSTVLLSNPLFCIPESFFPSKKLDTLPPRPACPTLVYTKYPAMLSSKCFDPVQILKMLCRFDQMVTTNRKAASQPVRLLHRDVYVCEWLDPEGGKPVQVSISSRQEYFPVFLPGSGRPSLSDDGDSYLNIGILHVPPSSSTLASQSSRLATLTLVPPEPHILLPLLLRAAEAEHRALKKAESGSHVSGGATAGLIQKQATKPVVVIDENWRNEFRAYLFRLPPYYQFSIKRALRFVLPTCVHSLMHTEGVEVMAMQCFSKVCHQKIRNGEQIAKENNERLERQEEGLRRSKLAAGEGARDELRIGYGQYDPRTSVDTYLAALPSLPAPWRVPGATQKMDENKSTTKKSAVDILGDLPRECLFSYYETRRRWLFGGPGITIRGLHAEGIRNDGGNTQYGSKPAEAEECPLTLAGVGVSTLNHTSTVKMGEYRERLIFSRSPVVGSGSNDCAGVSATTAVDGSATWSVDDDALPSTFFDPRTGEFADSLQARVRSKLMVNFGNPYRESRADSLIPEKYLHQAPSMQQGGFGSVLGSPRTPPGSPPHDSFDSVEEGEAVFVRKSPSRKSPKREEPEEPVPLPPPAKRPRTNSEDSTDSVTKAKDGGDRKPAPPKPAKAPPPPPKPSSAAAQSPKNSAPSKHPPPPPKPKAPKGTAPPPPRPPPKKAPPPPRRPSTAKPPAKAPLQKPPHPPQPAPKPVPPPAVAVGDQSATSESTSPPTVQKPKVAQPLPQPAAAPALDLESPDVKPAVDLPAGWMCVWSKSQKRWYFFDTKTNKSVWKWPP